MFTLHENLTVKETERYDITSVMFTLHENLTVKETERGGITSVMFTLHENLTVKERNMALDQLCLHYMRI